MRRKWKLKRKYRLKHRLRLRQRSRLGRKKRWKRRRRSKGLMIQRTKVPSEQRALRKANSPSRMMMTMETTMIPPLQRRLL